MKQIRTNLLLLLLAVILLVGIMPVPVFAVSGDGSEENPYLVSTFEELKQYFEQDEPDNSHVYIKLEDNITQLIPSGQPGLHYEALRNIDKTLDLNGYKLTLITDITSGHPAIKYSRDNRKSSTFEITDSRSGGTLDSRGFNYAVYAMTDKFIVSGGTIMGDYSLYDSGTLQLFTDHTIISGGRIQSGYAPVFLKSGHLDITGGNFSGDEIRIEDSTTCAIYDGVFSCGIELGYDNYRQNITTNYPTVWIFGGTFNKTVHSYSDNARVFLYGGTISGSLNNQDGLVFLAGGSFVQDPVLTRDFLEAKTLIIPDDAIVKVDGEIPAQPLNKMRVTEKRDYAVTVESTAPSTVSAANVTLDNPPLVNQPIGTGNRVAYGDSGAYSVRFRNWYYMDGGDRLLLDDGTTIEENGQYIAEVELIPAPGKSFSQYPNVTINDTAATFEGENAETGGRIYSAIIEAEDPGFGTEEVPYRIRSYKDLRKVAEKTQNGSLGDVYAQLVNDITETASVDNYTINIGMEDRSFSSNLHLDLNGYTLKRDSDTADKFLFKIESNNSIHVFDSSAEKTGKIVVENDGIGNKQFRNAIFKLIRKAHITIDSGNYSIKDTTGSDFETPEEGYCSSIIYCENFDTQYYGEGTVIVNGGTFDSTAYGIVTERGYSLNLNDGEWQCAHSVIFEYYDDSPVINIKGGTYISSSDRLFTTNTSVLNIYDGEFKTLASNAPASLIYFDELDTWGEPGLKPKVYIYGGHFTAPNATTYEGRLIDTEASYIKNRGSIVLLDNISNSTNFTHSKDVTAYTLGVTNLLIDSVEYPAQSESAENITLSTGEHTLLVAYKNLSNALKANGYRVDFDISKPYSMHDWTVGNYDTIDLGGEIAMKTAKIYVGDYEGTKEFTPHIYLRQTTGEHTHQASDIKLTTFNITPSYENSISSVKASVSAPKAGYTPDMTASFQTNLNYTAEVVEWYKGGTAESPGTVMADTEKFAAGQTYVVKIKFIPKDGYRFRNSATGKINGLTAYKSGSDPLTFNLAFTAESTYINTVNITDSYAPGGVLNSSLTSNTPGVNQVSIAWVRNGASISGGTPITYGKYSATIGIVADDGCFFDQNTKVNVFGRTLTGGSILSGGKRLFIALPESDISCDHKLKSRHLDNDYHWYECDICGEILDKHEHDWISSVEGGKTVYRCYAYECTAQRVIDAIEVWQYEVTDVPPVVGNTLTDIKPRNTYQADKALVTSTTWYVGSVSPANKLSPGATFEAGKKYYAVMTIEAQNNCFFNPGEGGGLMVIGDSSIFKFTTADKETMTSTTATATFEYDALVSKTLSVVLPEVSAGKTIREILDDTVAKFDGADGDCGLIVTQVEDYYHHSFGRTASGTYSLVGGGDVDEILDKVILPNKTYKISVIPDLNAPASTMPYIFENDITVTNNYGAKYTVHGNDLIWEIDAIYQTGSGLIDFIDLSGITAPQKDAAPSTDYTVNTPGVEKASISWTPLTGAFALGGEYTLSIGLVASEGYSFAPSPMVKVNCPEADVTTQLSGNTLIVSLNFPALTEGVSVSGEVRSYNPKLQTKLSLYASADTAHETVLYTAVIVAAEGSGQVTQGFSFPVVAAGIYDLVLEKSGHLVYTVNNIVVNNTDIDLKSAVDKPYSLITLLAGDVNGDGSITEDDVSVVRYTTNINRPTAAADNELADVNGDGSVTEDDVSIIRYTTHINRSTAHCTVAFE